MKQATGRQAAIRGFGWGGLAGLTLVALMYGTNYLIQLPRPLPQLLNEPILALMPGFVFGFLIDTLQHAGKVVEEFGLIVAMIAALGVLGAAWAWTSLRWRSQYSAMAFAGFGWLVVTAILLPVSGAGFLGLNDGPATPLVWAVLFAVYGVVLRLGADTPGRGDAADPGRRRLLSMVPVTIGAVSLGALGLRLLPSWYRAIFQAPEAALTGVVPDITPVANFYIVSKNFGDPIIDGSSWSLSVGGLVDHPMKLSLAALRNLPAVNEYVTLECISNNVGGDLMSTGAFTGVRLRDLLTLVSPRANGTWVAFRARDDYAESLPVSVIEGPPEILVAYDLDGAPLPNGHGYPARILIPGRYGMKGPKWLDSINLVDHESGGYWEQQGWDHNAIVRTTARFDSPRDSALVKLGSVPLAGVAFAGIRGISKVEYTADGGGTWTQAQLATPLSPFTWTLWQATWTPSAEGSYRLAVRAADGTGALQDKTGAASFPSGASGYHQISVDVSK
jgi:DMSO/TMAO reductase YedYZ molybdopterin-dependent catalytic subunit